MPLIKNGRVIADRYVNVLDDAPLPEGVPVASSRRGTTSRGQ